jgi:hypothetical protein
MTFDDDLRRALRRRAAPPGFTERTLARVEDAAGLPGDALPADRSRRRRMTVWIAAAVAASLVVAVGATEWNARQRAAEARRAADELTVALRITSETLYDARAKVLITPQTLENRYDAPSPR